MLRKVVGVIDSMLSDERRVSHYEVLSSKSYDELSEEWLGGCGVQAHSKHVRFPQFGCGNFVWAEKQPYVELFFLLVPAAIPAPPPPTRTRHCFQHWPTRAHI